MRTDRLRLIQKVILNDYLNKVLPNCVKREYGIYDTKFDQKNFVKVKYYFSIVDINA